MIENHFLSQFIILVLNYHISKYQFLKLNLQLNQNLPLFGKVQKS